MAFLGHKPKKYDVVVDHIDNNPSNNSLYNLQVITQRLNASKDRKNGTSKHVGVYFNIKQKRWNSSILINNKRIHLGCFKDECEANLFYTNALISLKDNKNINIKRPIKTSIYKGVQWYPKYRKWKSNIIFDKRDIHLGYFELEISAKNKYDEVLDLIKKGIYKPTLKRKSSSNFKGICFCKSEKKWRCVFTKNAVKHDLGRFISEQEAINKLISYKKQNGIS